MTTQVRPPRGGLRAPVHGAEAPLTRPERGAMRDVATFLLAGGGGQRLRPLTQETPKPALPFGPEGRIIDFSLEGCLAAGIPTVAVITQYRPAPLEAYLSTRFAPRFLARGGALALVRTGVGGAPACLGTVDAILEGLDGLDQIGRAHV